ncbi:MAG TPA: 4Fe-4S dicluster domain-containing protein, partial [Gemmatimonadaceae bacterium]|nr:4Fe-4S dicluster domain-containing protein [Gemmatimonadaceae bacterium]
FVRQMRRRSSWAAFSAAMAPGALRARVGARGAGLRLLLAPTSSPAEIELLDRLRSVYPDAGIHFYSPLRDHQAPDGFASGGRPVLPLYDLRSADVVLVVDADPLASGPFQLRYARDFADRRRAPLAGMSRLYAIESAMSVTGANADHRLRARPAEIESALAHLLAQLAPGGAGAVGAAPAPISAEQAAWLTAAARDLAKHPGRALVIVGEHQSARARALGFGINARLGAHGSTIHWMPSPIAGAGDSDASFAALTDALRARSVDTLVISGVNAAYASPGDIAFGELLRRVRNRVYHGLYDDETARGCDWLVPAAHYLESWGDARAYDGTLSVVQPLLRPLYDSHTRTELLALLAGEARPDSLALLRASWSGGDEHRWQDFLRRGFVPGSASTPLGAPAAQAVAGAEGGGSSAVTAAAPRNAITLVLRPDARVHDGCFANNGWLQELPDPITKLTWENAAQLSVATARRLGVQTGDLLALRANRQMIRLPVVIVPGHADDTISTTFGYGRTGAERVARGAGANVYPLWRSGSFVQADVTVERVGGHRDLPITQGHWTMEDRDPAHSMSVMEYARQAAAQAPGPRRPRRPLTLYEPQAPQGRSPQQWAMTIDLGTCIGCGACVVACQAENNIPVVGAEDVAKSREMHWLRIDRYNQGSDEQPRIVPQPMLCQHCEKAPCEYVCPVEATEHSADGLNEMIYNRCVGTRFCSNNCPYKVRRFNWFDYNAHLAEVELMVKNPDVTVRERGVMEKCSFCVQRIREAEITAGREGRALQGSDVHTACQQACPTRAIIFGSLTEPGSEVVRQREDPRAYAVLDHLGTEPRVRYLARVRNPNPELEERA